MRIENYNNMKRLTQPEICSELQKAVTEGFVHKFVFGNGNLYCHLIIKKAI